MSEKLIQAGAQLSNCAFNLAQRNPGEFTARDIEALDSARKAWDAATSAFRAAALSCAPTGVKMTEAEFCEWFGKNYYGDVVFSDSTWHAKSIYRRLAANPAASAQPKD